jgi:hypothetical protein
MQLGRVELFRAYSAVEEVWKPVVGREGQFEVSSLGRVRSLTRVVPVRNHPKAGYVVKTVRGRVLNGWQGANGYRMVSLGRRADGRVTCFLVHRLVCEAFHGPCPEGYEVCHGPNGKLDNRADQLCWGSRSKNHHEDKERDGTKIKGEKHYMAKLKEEQVVEIWGCRGMASPAVAQRYNVSPRTIRDIWNGKTWNCVTNIRDTAIPR